MHPAFDRDESITLRLREHRYRMKWPYFLFLVGTGTVILLALEALVIGLFNAELMLAVLRGVGAEIFTGREGGIAVFLEADVPPLLAMQYSAMMDLAISFIVFPLFVVLLNRYYDRDNILMRHIKSLQAKAERHRHRVERQGPLFLFAFMLIPFMVNGPLIGLLIGRIVRMRMETLVAIVVLATLLPAIGWTLFYDTLFALTERFLPIEPSHITIVVVGLIALLVIIGTISETIRNGRKKKKEALGTARGRRGAEEKSQPHEG